MPLDAPASETNKVVSPKFPIAESWTIDLKDGLSAPPVLDEARAYVAFRSGQVAAIDLNDKKELWRIDKAVTSPMAVGGGLLFVSAGDAIEAIRGADHATVWTVPRITTTAPLVAADDWLIAVTDTDVVAIAAKDGRIIWRKPAGGITLAPAVDTDHVYVGAKDGRLLALTLEKGDVSWEAFVPEGVTALGAYRGLVYAGGGDKVFYCFKTGKRPDWQRRIGSTLVGRIAVDEERVYFAARDNVVYALDRSSGVQRWQQSLRSRPFDGVAARGHIVFAPIPWHELPMLFDGNGKPSGTLSLPGDVVLGLPPVIDETATGVRALVATGGLANQWRLSLFASTGESSLVPVADFLPDAGAYLLTDPVLQPIGKVLGPLVLGDPPLVPLDAIGFPVVLRDPPLEPLTTLPGLQLRPLSPQLPPRREGSPPGA